MRIPMLRRFKSVSSKTVYTVELPYRHTDYSGATKILKATVSLKSDSYRFWIIKTKVHRYLSIQLDKGTGTEIVVFDLHDSEDLIAGFERFKREYQIRN